MSLDLAIKHGKEKRKPYHGAKACDAWCRNHGYCWVCRRNRLHKKLLRQFEQKTRRKNEQHIKLMGQIQQNRLRHSSSVQASQKASQETQAGKAEQKERAQMKAKTLSKEDLERLEDCVKTTIAGRAKAIHDSIDCCSLQYCWAIAEEMVDDFELLNKLEGLCEKEEE